jgi:hypothetical protein
VSFCTFVILESQLLKAPNQRSSSSRLTEELGSEQAELDLVHALNLPRT